MTNGRDECPERGSQNTERVFSSPRNNRRETECHTCGNEWTEYTGPECPRCSSHDTKRRTRGVSPHRYTEIVCYDCGLNRHEVVG